ncbi:hypothetical protein DYB25_008569 [Aphanomyces astaci]|uniref:Uncharacterized protein n=1 Tax=Aphanomyces astaci TaxID=112090 RepID=A0A397BQS4_APHAT|nr:hypothetical protein DYB25_008569 [Aphanomyces astaci]
MTIWAEVAAELNRMPGFSMVKKPGSLKTRFEYLLTKHEKGKSASLRKSGITEEYSERDQLLTDIKLRVDDFAENEAVRKDAAKRKLEGVENSGLIMRQLAMAELEMSAKKTEDAEITSIKRRKKSKKPAPTLEIASLMGIIREGIEDKERREAQRFVKEDHIAPSLVQSSCGRADDAAAGLDGTPEFICNGEKSTGLSQSSTQDCKCLERLHLIGARCTDKGWQS